MKIEMIVIDMINFVHYVVIIFIITSLVNGTQKILRKIKF